LVNLFQYEASKIITANGLRAREGRETNALNCKPITNLKEKYELSNYSNEPAALFCTLLLAVVHDMVHKTYQI
jgi:hypothetical protein